MVGRGSNLLRRRDKTPKNAERCRGIQNMHLHVRADWNRREMERFQTMDLISGNGSGWGFVGSVPHPHPHRLSRICCQSLYASGWETPKLPGQPQNISSAKMMPCVAEILCRRKSLEE